MRRMMQVLAIGAVLASGATPASAQDLGIRVGAKAPASIPTETLDGKTVDLAQFVGKQPVLIEFWATWCPSCKEMEPRLRAAHQAYGDRVKFIGVAVGVNQSPELVRRYAARHELPLEVYYDRRGEASEAFEVPATSYIVILDRRGTVLYTGLGGDQELRAALERAASR